MVDDFDDGEEDRVSGVSSPMMGREQPRERAQKLPSGAYRKQVKDPLNPGRTISITCPTEEEVLAKVAIVRQWRRDLGFSLITKEEVAQKLRLLTGETKIVALSLREIWEAYVVSFEPARQRALEGAWDIHFRARFERRSVLDVGAEDWDAWEKDRGETCGKGHIKTLFAMIRSAAQRQVKAGKIASFPWQHWKPSGKHGRAPVEREPLRSIEEIELLLRAARSHDERLRAWGMFSDALARVATLFFVGLRQGEGAALGWDHVRSVDTPDGPVGIVGIEFQSKDGWRSDHPTWTRPIYEPKRGSKRTLRTHPSLWKILLEHREYLCAWGLYRADGPVFPVPPKKGRTPGSEAADWRSDEWIIKPQLLRDFARSAGLEIDLDRFDAHALRHSFVTLELAATQNPVAVAQRSGHKDLRVFFQYAHAAGRGLPESPLRALRLQPPTSPHPVPSLPHVESFLALPAPEDAPAAMARKVETFARAFAPAAPVETITRERAAEIGELREGAADILAIVGPAENSEDLAEKLSAFERAFVRWRAAGKPTKYPREVAERMNQAYSRAYNAAIRVKRTRNETPEERKKRAQDAGFRTKRAVQGAWGKILRRFGEDVPDDEATTPEFVRDEATAAPGLVRDEADEATPFDDPPMKLAANGGAVVLPFRRRGAP